MKLYYWAKLTIRYSMWIGCAMIKLTRNGQTKEMPTGFSFWELSLNRI